MSRKTILAFAPKDRQRKVENVLAELSLDSKRTDLIRLLRAVKRQKPRDLLIKRITWAAMNVPEEWDAWRRILLRTIVHAIEDLLPSKTRATKKPKPEQSASAEAWYKNRYRQERKRDQIRAIEYFESQVFEDHCLLLDIDPDWAFDEIKQWFKGECDG